MLDVVNTGWVASAYLDGARFEPTGSRHEIVDGPLHLHEWDSLSALVITTLPTGTVVVITNGSMTTADSYTGRLQSGWPSPMVPPPDRHGQEHP